MSTSVMPFAVEETVGYPGVHDDRRGPSRHGGGELIRMSTVADKMRNDGMRLEGKVLLSRLLGSQH